MSAKKVARGVGHTLKWVTITAVLLIVIVMIVALVSLGKAGSDANTQSANVKQHIAEVHLGMTRAEVRAILGKPDSTQHFESGGLKDDTWYYGTLSTKGSYQFVFENGHLQAKNRY